MSLVHGSSVESEDQEARTRTAPPAEHGEWASPSFPNTGGVPGWGPWEHWPPPVLAPPAPAPPTRSARLRRFALVAVAAAVVIAAFAVGLEVSRPSTAPTSPVAAKVDPGVVDITNVLAYQSGELMGTGMVLTPGGVVLTNNHVIEGANTITVRDVGNGKRYQATVLGTDVTQDLALLQLKGATNLKTVSLGISAKVTVGEEVLAIGNAQGVGGTPSVASGRVVALDQSITAVDEVTGATEQLTGLIETNAALEPGDSGGPLANQSGKVIAMDTAASASYQLPSGSGQGFSIPIAFATTIATQIESGRSSSTVHVGPTAFLGVMAEQVPGVSGAFVTAVLPGTAALKAGLVPGDVIVSVGNETVASPAALAEIVGSRHPGDVVELGWVDRFGVSHSASVTLTSGPPQ